MSYIIEQKNNKGHIYLYKVTGYWDSAKQQARQKRRYLGKKDPKTGETVTPRKSNLPKACLDYGTVYLLRQISQQIKLTQCLKECFPEFWEDILNLAIFKICGSDEFYLFDTWCESNPISNKLSSQDISKLLSKINQYEPNFFKSWVTLHAKQGAAFYDLTSISTYSRKINLAEYGYNRDKERLPQINLGMLYSSITQYPLSYCVYSGSISDVKTLKNLLVMSKEWGVDKLLFVLDCGFYSQLNIEEMQANSIDFIVRLNPSTNYYKDSINSFETSSRYYFNAKEIQIGTAKVFAHTYHNESKKAFQFNTFMRKLSDIEKLIGERKTRSKKVITQILEDQELCGYYLFDDENVLKRNVVEIDKHIATLGKFVLLAANSKSTSAKVLLNYRNRDLAEEGFDNLKTEIGDYRLRTKSDATTMGSLFISFVSLILYSHETKTIANTKLTTPQVLSSLKNLKAFKLGDDKLLLSEVSKKNTDIFKLFKIQVPDVPCY